MILKLNKEDNDIIIEHLYEYNKGVPINDKMAMDVYIEEIQFKDDIIIKRIKIETIKIENIKDDEYGKGEGEIGEIICVNLNRFEEPYKSIITGAIREIKINHFINN